MIVQKFGGVALQTKELRTKCIQHIQQALQQYEKVAVVVSAMGRIGHPYATDQLLNYSEALPKHDQAKDLIAACGEMISASVLAAEITQHHIPTIALNPHQIGIQATGPFGNGQIQKVNTKHIQQAFSLVNCIVIPGFQGINSNGDIVTLGRGGSDLTAIAIGDALGANFIEFFKDVPGILNADPKQTPDAFKYDYLTYDQMLSLVKKDNDILQKKAVLYAKEKAIPLYVRGIAHQEIGTWITES